MIEPAWKLRLYDGQRVKVQLQFEPRDVWVGLFWRVSRHPLCDIFHAYICLLPLVPLHATVLWRIRSAVRNPMDDPETVDTP